MIEIAVDDEVRLRQLGPQDAAALFALVDGNRTHLREWLGWVDATQTVGDSETFIRKGMAQAEAGNGYPCGVRHAGALVGCVGLAYIDRVNRKSRLGYWLERRSEGKGIMTRAVRAMIGHLIRVEKVNRIEIACAPGNTKSRAIPERLGAREEGVARQAEWLYDHYEDHVIYGVLAEEWEG